MNIDKGQILDLLKSQGQHDDAATAEQQLPEQVDTDHPEHADILSKFGLNAGDLAGKLGGLGGLGGAGGAGGLGGLL